MNNLTIILTRIGGAYKETLEKCPSEIPKYVTIGITILFTGVFAALSGGYAFFKIFSSSEDVFLSYMIAIVMGGLWGFMIFNLDRFIVLSMKKEDDWKKEFKIAIPRIILAIIISLVVTKPLEVRLFQNKIVEQVDNSEKAASQQSKINIDKILGAERRTLKDELTQLLSKRDAIIGEINAGCKTLACENAKKREQTKLDRIKRRRRKITDEIRNLNSRIENTRNSINLTPEAKKEEIDRYTNQINRLYIEKKRNEEEPSEYMKLNAAYNKERNAALEIIKSEIKDLKEKISRVDQKYINHENRSEKAMNIAYSDNFIIQLEALGELTAWQEDIIDENGVIIQKSKNTMWWINLVVVILFIVIETSPIFIKLISGKGLYDIAMETYYAKRETELIHDANGDIHQVEQEMEIEYQASLKIKDVRMRLLEQITEDWERTKMDELNNANLDSENYKKEFEEVIGYRLKTNRIIA